MLRVTVGTTVLRVTVGTTVLRLERFAVDCCRNVIVAVSCQTRDDRSDVNLAALEFVDLCGHALDKVGDFISCRFAHMYRERLAGAVR